SDLGAEEAADLPGALQRVAVARVDELLAEAAIEEEVAREARPRTLPARTDEAEEEPHACRLPVEVAARRRIEGDGRGEHVDVHLVHPRLPRDRRRHRAEQRVDLLRVLDVGLQVVDEFPVEEVTGHLRDGGRMARGRKIARTPVGADAYDEETPRAEMERRAQGIELAQR